MAKTLIGISEEQQAFKNAITRAVREHLVLRALEKDRSEKLRESVLPLLDRLGVLTMCHSESNDRPGLDPITCCIATRSTSSRASLSSNSSPRQRSQPTAGRKA